MSAQFHWDPETYLDLIRAEVPVSSDGDPAEPPAPPPPTPPTPPPAP